MEKKEMLISAGQLASFHECEKKGGFSMKFDMLREFRKGKTAKEISLAFCLPEAFVKTVLDEYHLGEKP